MFEELVSKLLYSWQEADFRQVERWANGEVWQELQDIAKYQAAQQSVQPTGGTVAPANIDQRPEVDSAGENNQRPATSG